MDQLKDWMAYPGPGFSLFLKDTPFRYCSCAVNSFFLSCFFEFVRNTPMFQLIALLHQPNCYTYSIPSLKCHLHASVNHRSVLSGVTYRNEPKNWKSEDGQVHEVEWVKKQPIVSELVLKTTLCLKVWLLGSNIWRNERHVQSFSTVLCFYHKRWSAYF